MCNGSGATYIGQTKCFSIKSMPTGLVFLRIRRWHRRMGMEGPKVPKQGNDHRMLRQDTADVALEASLRLNMLLEGSYDGRG